MILLILVLHFTVIDSHRLLPSTEKLEGDGQTPTSEDTDFDLIPFFLPSGPSPSSTKYEGEELDSDADQVLRETILPPLHLLYAQSNTQLQNMKQELELLRNVLPSPIQ